MFGAGTACVVCPVEKIIYQGTELHIPTMKDGAPVTMKLYQQLTDIQVNVTSKRLTGNIQVNYNENEYGTRSSFNFS